MIDYLGGQRFWAEFLLAEWEARYPPEPLVFHVKLTESTSTHTFA